MIKKYLVLAVIVFLHGCETVATITPTSNIPEENGLVIFKLSSNSPSIGFFKYWQAVKVRSVNPSEKWDYFVGFSKKGNTRSAVYFGSLPEGEYQLVEFSSEQCGMACVSSKITLPKSMGTFLVKSGTITDLGHLIYQNMDNKSSLVVYGKSQSNWVASYLKEFYPNLDLSSFAAQNMLGWEKADENMQKLYDIVKENSAGLLKPYELSNGTVLFGSYLGRVRAWIPEKGVQSFETGIQGSIESVVEVAPGTWIAGSENGKILITRDHGESWSNYGEAFLNSSIIGLAFHKGKLFATVSNHKELSIYYSNLGEAWNLISTHPLKISFWTGVPIYPSSIAYKNKLVTSLPSTSLVVTDMEQLVSEEKKFPGGISAFTLSNDGVIRCTATKAIAANPYESDNWGSTWKISNHSRYMFLPYFKDKNNGYGLQVAPFSGKVKHLSVSRDGGKTWEGKEPPPYRTQYFSHLEKTGNIFATDEHNVIMMSLDNGKSWIVQKTIE